MPDIPDAASADRIDLPGRWSLNRQACNSDWWDLCRPDGRIAGEVRDRDARAFAAAMAGGVNEAFERAAKIAEGSAGPLPRGEKIAADSSDAVMLALAMQHDLGGGRDAIAVAIRAEMKPITPPTAAPKRPVSERAGGNHAP